MKRLDTPIARTAFVVLIAGLALMISGAALYDGFYRGIDEFAWQLFFDRHRSGWAIWAARVGLAFTLGGYICAFHWSITLGRLLRWIRTGA